MNEEKTTEKMEIEANEYKKGEIIEVKCPRCKHDWITKSNYVYVTCPSCLVKVKVRELK